MCACIYVFENVQAGGSKESSLETSWYMTTVLQHRKSGVTSDMTEMCVIVCGTREGSTGSATERVFLKSLLSLLQYCFWSVFWFFGQ